jgi:hypothetical protein
VTSNEKIDIILQNNRFVAPLLTKKELKNVLARMSDKKLLEIIKRLRKLREVGLHRTDSFVGL